MKALLKYAENEKGKMICSVLMSVISVMAGLIPFYCMYQVICLFVAGNVTALAILKWCIFALASLVTFPASFLCMGLTFKISGKNFETYDKAGAYMNSTIVEYIEGIEVIKAFGRAGGSYEKYAAGRIYRKWTGEISEYERASGTIRTCNHSWNRR